MNQPDLQVQITEDWIFLAQMETAVGYSARTPSGQHWRSPVLRFSFYEDVLDNVDHLLRNAKADRNKRSIDAAKGLEYYNTNMDESLAKMNKFADDLDDAAMKFGISGVVEGGLSIAAGIATGLGLILAPFTAGASIGLTIAGAALGVGAGLQGLVSEYLYCRILDTMIIFCSQALWWRNMGTMQNILGASRSNPALLSLKLIL